MKPSTSPTTTTQAMTEPKRHQQVTRVTPPSTPITTDSDRLTAGRREEEKAQANEPGMSPAARVPLHVCGAQTKRQNPLL